jgi:hypothetical protein
MSIPEAHPSCCSGEISSIEFSKSGCFFHMFLQCCGNKSAGVTVMTCMGPCECKSWLS